MASKRAKHPRMKCTAEVEIPHTDTETMRRETEQAHEWMRCTHGLAELTLLKRPCYPRKPTDSVQPVSELQWHLSQGQNK